MTENSQSKYHIWLDDAPIQDRKELHYPSKLIRITPVIHGAGGGVGQIFAGAALITLGVLSGGAGLSLTAAWAAGAVEFGGAIAFGVGTSLVLGGVSQLLASNPAAPTPSEKPNNQPSYLFNGAVNVTSQGQPVPILYGLMEVGSVVISAGLSTAQLPA